MLPAQQHFGADRFLRAQIHDRLIDELQLATLEGDVEIGLEADERRGGAAHDRIEDDGLAALEALRDR